MSSLTKKALLHAFTKLLKKKPFSQITIKELTDECSIARMTFYYHFDDIYDLLNWAIEEKLKEAVDVHFTYESWMVGYKNVYDVVLKDKQFFLKVFPSMDYKRVEQYMGEVAGRYCFDVVNERAKALGLLVNDQAKRYVANIFSSLMVSHLIRWMEGGMKTSPEVMVENFATVLHGSLETMLRQSALAKF